MGEEGIAMSRIGVFICHCGRNIAEPVDIPAVMEAARATPGVVYVDENQFTCSLPGQDSVRRAIIEQGLDRVVIGACSPRMHEETFRKALASAGLNSYLLEIANIREHCAWVHGNDRPAATAKAIELVRMAVAKAGKNQPLFPKEIGVTKRALVIGGGIAGIQAALDIAEAGHEVVLVEREPSIGGRMAQLDKTFPTLDCAACILTPKMVEASQHPLITLRTCAQVEAVRGFVGNFDVDIRQGARKVDQEKCTSCGICWQKCPEKVPSAFEMEQGNRSAIYIPFAQAVPAIPVIDTEHCRYIRYLKFNEDKEEGKAPPQCRICEKLCPPQAIDWEEQDGLITEKFGALVMAIGYKPFDPAIYEEFGYGHYPDVITGLELERLMSASGPTDGHVLRPSDGTPPKTVVFVSCIGSRDETKGHSYCSQTCCMYMAKHAILLQEHDPEVQSYIFYIDIRATGKGYEEFSRRAQEESGARYLRGRIAKIYPKDGRLVVQGEDSLIGRPVEITADLVVLSAAMEPNTGAAEMAQRLSISHDSDHFFVQAHPKLRPVETQTDGVFLAGSCIFPSDIPQSVAQGSAAASKVAALLNKDHLVTNPMTALVDPLKCTGCLQCVAVCPFNAVDTQLSREQRTLAVINEGTCKGCGLCVSACRPGAIDLRGTTNQQLLAEVMALW